jgi:thiamine transport system substrate-binding protein
MKHFFKLILFLCVVGFFGCAKRDAARHNEVVVYAYDSFVAEWGAGPLLAAMFTEKTGLALTFIDTGDAVQTFSRAVLEKDAPQADAIVGVDNNLLSRAKEAGIARAYKPANAAAISAGLQLDPAWEFTPFDWSYFALIYNSAFGITPPASLADLTASMYEKKLILLDPRVSTPGLGFAAWTLAEFGNAYLDYWRALKPNILSIAPGWSAGYGGLFLQGEAPLVISYTTSPSYHVAYDKTTQYKALIFESGHPRQIEFAAVLKGAPNPGGGEAFIDFLLSVEAQNILPETQWMYPANKDAVLPPSFATDDIFLPAGAVVQAKAEVESTAVTKAVEEIMRLLAE